MNRMAWTVGILAALAWAAPGATPYFVATNGVDNDDAGRGLSWDLPFATISNAAAKANISPGNEIVVSNGTYHLTAHVALTNGTVCRGFSGDPRDVIVDGGGQARGFYLNGGTLAAVTVTHGNPPSASLSGHGGGVYGGSAAAAVVSNCVIADNTAARGGGVYQCTVWDSTLAGNVTTGSTARGGGLMSGPAYRSLIRGSASAGRGGGVCNEGGYTLRDCTIAENSTTVYGGAGVYVSGLTPALFENCLIVSNVNAGTAALPGAGVYLNQTYSVFSNCVVAYNNNTNKNGSGGAFAILGGGSAVGSNRFVNCLVYSNLAYTGAGVNLDQCIAVWEHCTLTRNRAVRPLAEGISGGGILGNVLSTTKLRMINCILYGNLAAAESNYYFAATMDAVLSNSCAAPSVAAYGDGNIADDPEFLAPDSGDFRLAPASPGVNAGLPLEWLRTARDLEGRARVDRFSGLPDMGAFERIPAGMMIQFR